MAITDFLFNGKPPPSTTTYGSTSTNLPTWYQDYTKGILAKANAIAAEPYQAYGGPRIAGFTGDQKAAQDRVRQGAGMYQPTMNNAISSAFASGNPNAGTDAASPWLNRAGQGAYQTVGNYMNPYNDAVTNRIAQMGARNLQENLMPAINQDFVRAGQYGSRNMMGEVGKALRDTQESVLAQQSNVLQQGYGQALQAAQTDAQRFGQLGEAFGNFAQQGQQQQLDSAKAAAGLGTAARDMYGLDTAALDTIGGQQQGMNQQNLDLAYGDFKSQRDYPLQQLNIMQTALQGQQIPSSTTTSDTGPANYYQPSPLQSVIGTGLSTWNLLNGN